MPTRSAGVATSCGTRGGDSFCYRALNWGKVARLRNGHGIYAVGTGRICVAALNSRNIDAVVDAIAAVL